ncbi:hypothetical protein O7635_18865 [Asanoa sp. WMMD1127]|uniref:pilus assembly protein TadG-related protein n=1 Tax=Asanoa sp. WMMD1127 TaxID=3016107 RepID=UPI002417803B|nr:pilus assembly protein TadG-related protein [Asanoa sp. WMMD1127]MDG4823923.1 hypothetical protein [Asanoa sp. WMMD1127]
MAVFFGFGVALGVCALVLDIGLIAVARKQLQTGADAAAVEVARTCATSAAACGGADSGDTAIAYAQENVPDGAATAVVCGRGEGLAECPPPAGAGACAQPAPETGAYAEVHTSILRADGSTLLPPVFAQAVVDGFDGAAVTACARVTWGSPAAARALALTVSTCDWQRMTDGGALPSAEQAIPLFADTDPAACGRAGAGAGDPGGFRWVAGADATCRTATSAGAQLRVTDPTERPTACLPALESLVGEPGRPVAVPIFSAVSAAGDYTVRGIAAFVVTGWQLPDSAVPSPRITTCDDGVDFCVFGFFTRALVPGGGTVGGPDLGAQITALIG